MHSPLTRRTIMATIGTATALASPMVMAHLGADGAPNAHDNNALASLVAGALHPLTGLDHLVAMISVGTWSALSLPTTRQESNQASALKALLAAPVAFAATLLLGALAGMSGLRLPGVEPMIAASLLVLGLLVATRLRLRAGLGAALVATFALFHGMAHGSELGGHAAAALAGMVLSTAGLHGLGMAIGLKLRNPARAPQRWLSRAAGAGVALLGLSLLTPAIASAL